MKKKISMLFLVLTGGTLWAASGCKDVSCDESLTRTNPNDATKEEHLVLGNDGLCHWPWYDKANWGTKCATNEDCGGNLICLAPDLPICSQINCDLDPKKDDVCGTGFMCFSPGKTSPNVCIPAPATGTGGGSGTGGSDGSGGSNLGGGGGTGLGGESATGGSGTGGTVEESPNIGTACSSAGDPVCVGGTFCENTNLMYCTVVGCTAAGAAKDACDGASGAGYMCMAGTPFPDSGICYKP